MIRFLTYLIPGNAIAAGMVLALSGLFVTWLVGLLRHDRALARARQTIATLRRATNELVTIRASGDEPATRAGFARLAAEHELTTKDVVVQHVERIVVAGATQGHLDLAELSRHTEAALLRGEAARRWVLSLFLIIGLLGTLFGLADAMAELVIGETRTNLGRLLSGLRSAFAPSIWGVTLSVIGTLLFAGHYDWAVAPTLHALRRATLGDWGPRLYSTPVQIIDAALARSLEATAEVAKLAGEIRGDTGGLRTALSSSLRMTEDFSARVESLGEVLRDGEAAVAKRLNELAKRTAAFAASLERWSASEADIRRTQQQVATSLDAQSLLLREARDSVKGLYQPFVDLTAAVIQELETTRATQRELARHAEAAIVDWRSAVIEHVDAQTKQVSDRIAAIDASLRSLKVPFESAADRVANTAIGFQHAAQNALRAGNGDGGPPVRRQAGAPDGLRRIEQALAVITEELRRDRLPRRTSVRDRLARFLRL